MSRITGLRAEFQEPLNATLKSIVSSVAVPEPQAIARELWTELRRLEADGEEWAAAAIEANGPAGWRMFVSQTLKDDHVAIRVHNNGWVELPARYSVRPRNPETGEFEGGFQLPLWWELSWSQFIEMLEGLSNQRDLLSSRIAALREVAALRDQFPESQTPGEACGLAGIDPRRFEAAAESA